MNESLVTAIVLNWNGGDEVIGCIEHVLTQSYRLIEIIVVDNASTDGSHEAICSRFPSLHMIENSQNLGYATGMNQGIEQANGEYVLLLNQDAWIRGDFIENAVRTFGDLPADVGMLAGQVYRLDHLQKTRELVSGGILLRRRFQLVADPDLRSGHFTLSPVYCSPFIRRAMLSDVKVISGHCFDDRYFAFGEDLDLTLRAQLRGWRCFFSPSLVTWHTHSGSLGGKVRLWQKPLTIRTHSLRNRYTTILKDLPFGVMLYLAPFLIISEIAAWPFFLACSPSTIPCLIKAYIETFSQLPSTLRLRRALQHNKVVSNRSLLQFFRGF